jgi:hypothetical protein
VVQTLGDLIEPSGLPAKPASKWGTLSHVIAAAGKAIVPFRQSVAVLLPNIDLDGEMLLKRGAGVFELSVGSLARRRPAFVLTGSLDGVYQFFGIDHHHAIRVRVTTNGLVLLFGTKHGRPVAVHAAFSPHQERFIHQLWLGTKLGANALPEYAPAIVEKTANRMTVEHIQGRSLMRWGGSERELQAAILVALEPLKTLHAQRNLLLTPDEKYVRSLQGFVEGHKHRTELSMALHVLEDWDPSALGSVTVHGDYWLNNVLGFEDRVTGIVDWDRARRNGCPGFDALHLGFMSYAMWANKYVSDLLASLWTNEWPYPWLAHYTNLICDMFTVSRSDIQALATMLWLSYLYHHSDREPRAEWDRRMIEPVWRALSSAPTPARPVYVG